MMHSCIKAIFTFLVCVFNILYLIFYFEQGGTGADK